MELRSERSGVFIELYISKIIWMIMVRSKFRLLSFTDALIL